MKKTVCIKVDVDTFRGLKEGVPRLVALFSDFNLKATFFVPMGKDHTGRTVKRVFRRGFLSKAGRVGVLETYGVMTLLYGLLLPGPEIALAHRTLLTDLRREGHEVGIHGLDHVFWHDSIKGLSGERTGEEIEKASAIYREIFGQAPQSFAAPGWMINAHALRCFAEQGYLYTSNTRGYRPYFPVMEGERFDVLEIPSTLPTLDEVIGIAARDGDGLATHFFNSLTDGLNVLTVHTELEGRLWAGFLRSFIDKAREAGFRFARLDEIAGVCLQSPGVPACPVVYKEVAGRAGEVSCQGSPV
jgi:undecaprenyl phosphate-alpha-L-ara4FN deformylase